MAGLLSLLVLLGLLASCGGGTDDDAEEAEQVVRDFVSATNARDADRLCGEILTQDYMEKATGASGEAAGEACRSELKLLKGLRLRLLRVADVELDGDQARVRAQLLTGRQQQLRVFEVRREDGRWRLAGGSEQ